ncbi:MotA/TolQ/ExbB proton channel family protein [Cyclobacterium qasimii]|uniref:Metalloporphyrin transporter protein n=2 Tax=Cyclobacterium qasimii TaxID=1350429 RepID=S7V5F6_9BACT|nr:MotA/TolQ/ExbB proton channel family protein [Cyclobacterium qasimii]EPR65375.1 Metalloporphyrin transporter protein [Cyclobacterium qasimii M12-11B]GEO20093.1 membrane protein [Cyclobacterium qasimii]
MEILNKLLYWISTGLMLPVIVVLLFLFLKSLLAIGGFYGDYVARLKAFKTLTPFINEVATTSLEGKSVPEGKLPQFVYLKNLLASRHSAVNREKTLADFELEMTKQLGTIKTMSKLGPVLGLMGTLIPMGPALVGLASGDIASMAENMQVAFSTTVVGLIVGAVGFMLTEVKQRWFAKDLSQLIYISDLITEENETEKK